MRVAIRVSFLAIVDGDELLWEQTVRTLESQDDSHWRAIILQNTPNRQYQLEQPGITVLRMPKPRKRDECLRLLLTFTEELVSKETKDVKHVFILLRPGMMFGQNLVSELQKAYQEHSSELIGVPICKALPLDSDDPSRLEYEFTDTVTSLGVAQTRMGAWFRLSKDRSRAELTSPLYWFGPDPACFAFSEQTLKSERMKQLLKDESVEISEDSLVSLAIHGGESSAALMSSSVWWPMGRQLQRVPWTWLKRLKIWSWRIRHKKLFLTIPDSSRWTVPLVAKEKI